MTTTHMPDHPIPTAQAAELARLRAVNAELLAGLKRIAFEPLGDAEATHAQALEMATDIARAAIARAEGRS